MLFRGTQVYHAMFSIRSRKYSHLVDVMTGVICVRIFLRSVYRVVLDARMEEQSQVLSWLLECHLGTRRNWAKLGTSQKLAINDEAEIKKSKNGTLSLRSTLVFEETKCGCAGRCKEDHMQEATN